MFFLEKKQKKKYNNNMINIIKLFNKLLVIIPSIVIFLVLVFSLSGVNTFAQPTEDPCSIAFCFGGFGTNQAYGDESLTPGERAFLIFVDVAGLMTFIINSIAVIFIVYGGFQILTSNGAEDKFKKGKQTLIYAILGMLISVIAYGIVASIIGFLNNTRVR